MQHYRLAGCPVPALLGRGCCHPAASFCQRDHLAFVRRPDSPVYRLERGFVLLLKNQVGFIALDVRNLGHIQLLCLLGNNLQPKVPHSLKWVSSTAAASR